jgi:N-acetylglucosamine kinase-like BadF-type ATPase
MSYFLGIDGGGSKTAAALVDEAMTLLGEGRAGPSNHLRVGLDEARDNVIAAAQMALANSGIGIAQVDYSYCGIAGSDHPMHRTAVVDSLRDFFHTERFTVDSDARVALTAGVGFGEGISIIAGTGSVAFGRNSSGREARAGGWGPTLGDEGSGYSIARRGLTAIVRAFDGRGPRTMMTEVLCDHYGMCHPDDLPYFVYAPTTHADDIARYGRMVIEAAQLGDAVAKEILDSEGSELGRTVAAVAEKLRMTEISFPVAYSGGAFAAGDLLIGPMEAVLRTAVPGAKVAPAHERPVMGAARMAIHAAVTPRPTRA